MKCSGWLVSAVAASFSLAKFCTSICGSPRALVVSGAEHDKTNAHTRVASTHLLVLGALALALHFRRLLGFLFGALHIALLRLPHALLVLAVAGDAGPQRDDGQDHWPRSIAVAARTSTREAGLGMAGNCLRLRANAFLEAAAQEPAPETHRLRGLNCLV